MGVAVSTATDVAKAAAGIVLTDPGLGGILFAIEEGRAVFQRVVTYTLGILVNKCVTLVVLGAGLVLTGHAVLTPLLQAISMLTNDFVSMARTADRATPSTRPNTWRVNNLALAAIPLASFKFLFCISVLAAGWFLLGLTMGQMQTLTFVMLVFAAQAVVYVLRERGRMWRSRPVMLMMISLVDITIFSTFAIGGILMRPLPITVIVMLLIVTAAFAIAFDQVKVMVLAVARSIRELAPSLATFASVLNRFAQRELSARIRACSAFGIIFPSGADRLPECVQCRASSSPLPRDDCPASRDTTVEHSLRSVILAMPDDIRRTETWLRAPN